MIRITMKQFKEIKEDSDEWCRLLYLCFEQGRLREFLLGHEYCLPSTKVFIATDTKLKEIVGWAMCDKTDEEQKHRYSISVYVGKDFRRQGIATKLVNTAVELSKARKIKCFMHDGPSGSFYGTQFGAEVYDTDDINGCQSPAEFTVGG